MDRWNELVPYTQEDVNRSQLKQINRQFVIYTKNKIALRNNLISFVDQKFPGINSLFTSPVKEDGKQQWIDFVYCHWHADLVRKKSKKAFILYYSKWCEKMDIGKM